MCGSERGRCPGKIMSTVIHGAGSWVVTTLHACKLVWAQPRSLSHCGGHIGLWHPSRSSSYSLLTGESELALKAAGSHALLKASPSQTVVGLHGSNIVMCKISMWYLKDVMNSSIRGQKVWSSEGSMAVVSRVLGLDPHVSWTSPSPLWDLFASVINGDGTRDFQVLPSEHSRTLLIFSSKWTGMNALVGFLPVPQIPIVELKKKKKIKECYQEIQWLEKFMI